MRKGDPLCFAFALLAKVGRLDLLSDGLDKKFCFWLRRVVFLCQATSNPACSSYRRGLGRGLG